MAEWFERFFDGLYARVLPKSWDDARSLDQARIVKRLLGLRKGQSCLDVPSGMGRLTIPLARMGLRMTGADLTASYLTKAQRLARRAGVDIRWVQSDMREIAFDAEFDAAFNWFGSFGYFSDADNLRFCRRIFAALRPGGRFLIEGMNLSWIRAHFRPDDDRTIGGVRIISRSRWEDAEAGRIASTWTFCRGKATERHVIRMRIFSGATLRELLQAAGFRGIRLYPNPSVGRFTRRSRRIIAVATRPGR